MVPYFAIMAIGIGSLKTLIRFSQQSTKNQIWTTIWGNIIQQILRRGQSSISKTSLSRLHLQDCTSQTTNQEPNVMGKGSDVLIHEYENRSFNLIIKFEIYLVATMKLAYLWLCSLPCISRSWYEARQKGSSNQGVQVCSQVYNLSFPGHPNRSRRAGRLNPSNHNILLIQFWLPCFICF